MFRMVRVCDWKSEWDVLYVSDKHNNDDVRTDFFEFIIKW
jgi:hypothetical protein